MVSRFEDEPLISCQECENCGATEGLLRCSRCHASWFCSLKCHKAYWPFHKSSCKRNDFADAVEQQEPKFAAWMRQHNKLAVLQDDEVDRLERSSRPGGWLGLGRAEVMTSMYGRMDPAPAAPTYSALKPSGPAVPAAGAADASNSQQPQQRSALLSPSELAWRELVVPAGMGLTATTYKWRQNLSHVEVFLKLPGSIAPKQVRVALTPCSLSIAAAGDVLLAGQLQSEVKVEDSTWFCDDGILHLQLLKRNRKGHYSNGCTAADTFWFSLMANAQGVDRLPGWNPPTRYYSMAYEADD